MWFIKITIFNLLTMFESNKRKLAEREPSWELFTSFLIKKWYCWFGTSHPVIILVGWIQLDSYRRNYGDYDILKLEANCPQKIVRSSFIFNKQRRDLVELNLLLKETGNIQDESINTNWNTHLLLHQFSTLPRC